MYLNCSNYFQIKKVKKKVRLLSGIHADVAKINYN